MNMKNWPLIYFLLLVGIERLNASRPVSNEDIRDAILSVVHMIRSTEDKLERHEYREKALGEQLKKGLSTIEKRLRHLEPVKGTLSRLDERLANVETILIQKDERERIQRQKTFDMVDQIHNSLPQLFETLKNDIITSLGNNEGEDQKAPDAVDATSKNDLEKLQKEIAEKIDNASNNAIANMEGQFLKLKEENKKNSKLQEKATENLENVKRHINSSQQVLEKYENKLAQYDNKIDATTHHTQNQQIDKNVQQALELQKINLDQILSEVKQVSNKLQKVSTISDMETIKNLTLTSLGGIKRELITQTTETARIMNGVKNINDTSGRNKEEIKEAISQMEKITEINISNLAHSLKQLKNETLEKLEQSQKTNGKETFSQIKAIEEKIEQTLPEIRQLEKIKNTTLQILNELTFQAVHNHELIKDQLEGFLGSSERKAEEFKRSILENGEKTNENGLKQLKNDIETLGTLGRESFQQILYELKMVWDKVQEIPERPDLEAVKNDTLQLIFDIQQDIHTQTQQQKQNGVEKNKEELKQSVVEIAKITEITTNLSKVLIQIEVEMRAIEINQRTQKANVDRILYEVSNKYQGMTDLENVQNSTLQFLEDIKYRIDRQAVQTNSLINGEVGVLQNITDKTKEELDKSVSKLGEMTEIITANVVGSFQQLKNEIKGLGKLEKLMVQSSDGVLDTKRRVEYGVHQISLEVADLIKSHSKEVNATINGRFDNLETTILDGENGALANATSKIGSEIDQVWRQIGIMHQQMTSNAETLNKLQNQTDVYVNGSLNSMDSMRGKVSQITSRMLEVDDNLNYLLGKLSLVTHEFNQIKTGLGEALDDIKGSFQTVQQKIRDVGPGPHPIPSHEIDGANTKNESI